MSTDEQCPNCWELVSEEELMCHGGYCKVCHDDGVSDEENEQ